MAIDTTSRPTSIRWAIFFLACATSWLLYVHRYAWGVIKPYFSKEHPELSGTELGLLDSVFNFTYAAGQIPTGAAGDLFGPRLVLCGSILTWSLLVGAMALTAGFWGMLSARLPFGLAQAGTYPCLGKVTRSWFPLSIRTSVQGAVASFSGRLGGACASLVIATLLMGTLHLSWRDTLLVLAVFGVVLGLAFGLLFRNTPREHPWVNTAEKEVIEAGETPFVPGVRPRLQLQGRNGLNLGMVLLYAFASTFSDQLYVNWIPSFLVQAKGLGDKEMGVFASLPLLGGAVGGLCGGFLNDLLIRRTGRQRLARSAVGFTGKFMSVVLISLSVGVEAGQLVMVVLLVSKFFTDWGQPTVWGTITDISGRAASTMFGVVNMTGNIGALIAGLVMGRVLDVHGWTALFVLVAAVDLVAALCWLGIDCTRKVVVEPPPAPQAREEGPTDTAIRPETPGGQN